MSDLPIIGLRGESAVIGDLHLDPFDPQACEAFAEWTRQLVLTRLIVVGDLFDAWVGPAHERAPGSQRVLGAFRDLAQRNVAVHVLQGNRDFLLGKSFEEACGCRVYPEGVIGVQRDGRRVLLLHGDELCTKDLAYQRLRRVTHSALVQTWGPRLPLFLSVPIARRMRRASQKAVAMKLPADKEIQGEAGESRLREARGQLLICGHVHRSRDVALGESGRWLIVDAWREGPRDAVRILGQGNPELVSSDGFGGAPPIQ